MVFINGKKCRYDFSGHTFTTAFFLVVLPLIIMIIPGLVQAEHEQMKVNLGALVNDGEHGARHRVAMEIAIEYLNQLPPVAVTSITDLEVSIVWNLTVLNTLGDPDLAVTMAQELVEQHEVIGIVGPVYSSESVRVSSEVANRFAKPFVSYSATSVALSNVTSHPFFLRTVPPNQAISESIIDFLYLMEWSQISVICSDEAYGLDGAEQLKKLASMKQVEISTTIAIGSESEIEDALKTLQSQQRKVFVVFVAEFEDISYLVKTAHALNMMGQGYVWIFSETFSDLFRPSVEDTLILDDPTLDGKLDRLLYSRLGTSFWTKQHFLLQRWYERTGSPHLSQLNAFTFDAVLCFGYAVREMINMRKSVEDGVSLRHYLQQLDFLGASGRVKFSSTEKSAERVGSSVYISNLLEEFDDEATNATLRTSDVVVWDLENSLSIIKDTFGHSYVYLPGEAEPVDLASSTRKLQGTISSLLQWKALPKYNNPPSKRHSSCLAIFGDNDEMLLFGGSSLVDMYNDFWKFSFKTQLWTQIYPLSEKPPPMKDTACFVLNEDFYLFGGFDDSRFYNELWKFSFKSQQWLRFSFPDPETIPDPRRTPRAAVDESSGIVYFFGGETIHGDMNDIWQFDLENSSFTRIEPAINSSIPPGLRDHCFVMKDRNLVVFGGRSLNEPGGSSDLWFFNLDTLQWKKQQQIDAPAKRYSMMCDISSDELWIGFGWSEYSNDGTQLDDIHALILNFSSPVQTWVSVEESVREFGHESRDSTMALFYENYLVWATGWGFNDLKNDFWRIDVLAGKFEQIHGDSFSPPGIAKHSAVLIGSDAVLFGGINNKKTPTSDIYTFTIDTESWLSVTPTGEIPKARHDHAAVAIGDLMYIFGGHNSLTNEYYGDLWYWSKVLNSWKEIQPKGQKPSPRAFHTAQALNSGRNILVYGGVNKNTQLNELWLYSVAEEVWELLDMPHMKNVPQALGVRSTVMDDKLVVGSGASWSYTPDTIIHVLQLELHSANFSVFTPLPSRFSKHQATLNAVSDSELLMFGGNSYHELSNDLIRITRNKTEMVDVSNSFNIPHNRDGHTSLYFGDKLLIFGGTGPIANRLYRNNDYISNDVWVFRLGPVCTNNTDPNTSCYQCGFGTYEYRSQCLACSPGFYNDEIGQRSCKPCPKGFFGLFHAASSESFCYPCESGTYNDKEGQADCQVCGEDEFCPIGSVSPLSKNQSNSYTTSPVESQQPKPLANRPTRNRNINFISMSIAALCTGLLLIFYLTTRRRLGKLFTWLDFLFEDMHNGLYIASLFFLCANLYLTQYCCILYYISPYGTVLEGPMFRKKNSFGGFASIAALFFCIAMIVSTLVPAITDNMIETRSLIPNQSVRAHDLITTSFTASVTLLDYRGLCSDSQGSCTSRIKVFSSGLKTTATKYSCRESVNLSLPINQRNCTITFECRGCSFDRTDKASVQYDIVESKSFTHGFVWAMDATSGLSHQNSSLSGRIASRNSYFRGLQTPTSVEVTSIQTTYTRTSVRSSEKNSGWLLDFASSTRGETTDWRSFNHKNGVSFKFDITRSVSSLEVIQSPKKEVYEIIFALLGALAGLLGLMGKVVQKVELFALRGMAACCSFFSLINKDGPIINIEKGIKAINTKRKRKTQYMRQHDYDDLLVPLNEQQSVQTEEYQNENCDDDEKKQHGENSNIHSDMIQSFELEQMQSQ